MASHRNRPSTYPPALNLLKRVVYRLRFPYQTPVSRQNKMGKRTKKEVQKEESESEKEESEE